MTIKPVNNSKSNEKKENHGHQEAQNQNLVPSSVRCNHRNVVGSKSNVEGQSPQRRGDVFEDISRHRRSPHKSCARLKREHHKRDQRDREKLCSSPQYHQMLSNGNSPHSSPTSGKSPKHVVSLTTGPSTTQTSSSLSVIEESFSGYNSGDEHLMSKENLLTPDEWKDRDEAFVKAMSERGFIIKNIVEDGACLFRAISLQIYGDEEMHEVIRQQTMDYIYQNREYFAHFVTEDINSYVKRKRSNDSHGNHIEIQAMSEIYNRPVELYCYQTTPINIFNSEQINNGYDPLRLSYQRASHYNAILDPYNASVGVGLGLAGYKPDSQTREAIRLSEELEIEQTMFEDKLKTTDWEATNEAIEEQIARESYLQWCRENMQITHKTATNSTSSTVTSAEAQSSCFTNCNQTSTTSYVEQSNTKDAISYLNNVGSGGKDDKQMLEPTNKISTGKINNNNNENNVNDYCCDSDDTDISSTSSVDHQKVDKMYRRKTTKHKQSRRYKRRRVDDSKQSVNKSDSMDKEYPMKRSKTSIRLETISDESKTSTNFKPPYDAFLDKRNSYLPCTSKQAEKYKPISQFYKSLLESSYAEDGLEQLSENEMVQKAIEMSRMDFIEEQRRKYGVNNYSEKFEGDEDSDTPSG